MSIKEKLESLRQWSADLDIWLSVQAGADAIDFCDPEVDTESIRAVTDDQLRELVRVTAQVLRAIVDMPTPDYRRVLLARYFTKRKWESIAADMHYSMSHLYKIHIYALQELDDVIKKQEGEDHAEEA